jgi:hypothetical protein
MSCRLQLSPPQNHPTATTTTTTTGHVIICVYYAQQFYHLYPFQWYAADCKLADSNLWLRAKRVARYIDAQSRNASYNTQHQNCHLLTGIRSSLFKSGCSNASKNCSRIVFSNMQRAPLITKRTICSRSVLQNQINIIIDCLFIELCVDISSEQRRPLPTNRQQKHNFSV